MTRWVTLGPCLLIVACERGPEGRQWDFERMDDQRRYDVGERSAVFSDGKVMQQPPEGAIAREYVVSPAAIATGGERNGLAQRIPVPVTPELLDLGQSRFEIFCAACHGTGGFGGSIVAKNMREPRPPSLRSAEVRELPPGHVYRVIVEGRGRMPSYASKLAVVERWAVVAHLQRLQARDYALPRERTDSIRGAELERTRPARPAARARAAGSLDARRVAP